MNLSKFISILIIAIFSLNLSAQNQQQGIVKLKGRMNTNGSITAGDGILGVTVNIKGFSPFLTSQNGIFTFPVKGQKFYLTSVQTKKNLRVLDPDMFIKAHAYHLGIPFYITMEEPQTHLEDKVKAEQHIRRILRKQLTEKEDSIEKLRAENAITVQKYNELLSSIYAEEDKNEQLVSDIAEHYADIDYDLIGEKSKQISEAIINGNLTLADSLLKSKGLIQDRIQKVNQIKCTNAIERQNITIRENNLTKSELYVENEISDIANDCYSLFNIHRLQHNLDSASYYIEQRALLDTLNFDYVWECGSYFLNEQNYDKARYYLELVSRNRTLSNDYIALALNDLSLCYTYMGKTQLGKDALERSYKIRMDLVKENPSCFKCSAALANGNYAATFSQSDTSFNAKPYFERAIQYYSELAEEIPLFQVCLANIQENYGYYLLNHRNLEQALTFAEQALNVRLQYARDYPKLYNTLNLVSITDISNLLIEKEYKNVELTKECLLILASAASDNKEHISSTAKLLAWLQSFSGKGNECKKSMGVAEQYQNELYKEKPYKYITSSVSLCIDEIDMYGNNSQYVDSLAIKESWMCNEINDKGYLIKDTDYKNYALFRINGFLGNAYQKNNVEKSLASYKESLNALTKLRNNINVNYNDSYIFIERQIAADYFSLSRIPEAKSTLDSALIYTKENHLTQLESIVKYDLANLYLGQNNYIEANQLLKEIISVLDPDKNAHTPDAAFVYFYLGGTEKMLGNIESAKSYLQKSLNIFNMLNSNEQYSKTIEIINKILSILN